MKVFRTVTGLCLVSFLLIGCNSARSGKPISSKRGIETLERKPGEIPTWKKTGNLTLKPSGEVKEDDFTSAIRITTDKAKRTINANGKDVIVAAGGTNLTIKGGCRKLVVVGSKNQITCDFVNEIAMKGEYNRLTCNSVAKGTVNGSGNNVAWKTPAEDKIPEIDFKGVNNTLEHLN